jgi:hypothetical protein
MGERAGIGVRLVARGEGSLVALVAVAFLSLGLIGFRRVVPGWPARSGRPELSVNKVSAVRLREAKGRLSYKRGGRELKGKVRE